MSLLISWSGLREAIIIQINGYMKLSAAMVRIM
jgi:hypothetical protein